MKVITLDYSRGKFNKIKSIYYSTNIVLVKDEVEDFLYFAAIVLMCISSTCSFGSKLGAFSIKSRAF